MAEASCSAGKKKKKKKNVLTYWSPIRLICYVMCLVDCVFKACLSPTTPLRIEFYFLKSGETLNTVHPNDATMQEVEALSSSRSRSDSDPKLNPFEGLNAILSDWNILDSNPNINECL